MKGRLIVIDGTDGSGKATQSQLLVERLRKEGFRAEIIDYPRYGEKSAALVEDYLNGRLGSLEEVSPYQASVLYAVDRFVDSKRVKKMLAEGVVVVANRYVSSNMGHQAAKISGEAERNAFLEWVSDLEFSKLGISRPDLNVLLYLPPELGQELVDRKGSRDYLNGRKRDLHEGDLEHLRMAAGAYQRVAEKEGWSVVECAPRGVLLSKPEIHGLVWERVEKLFQA